MSNWKRLESALPEGSNRARVRREERGGWGCHWRRGCPGTPGCPPVDQSEVSIHDVDQSEVSIYDMDQSEVSIHDMDQSEVIIHDMG